VTRYKGRIHLYELWDEVNASASWSGSYDQLVELAKNAYRIIKSIDPSAMVLTPATVGGIAYQPRGSLVSGADRVWIEQYFKAGGARYADAFNWHGYLMQPSDSLLRMPESDSPCHMESWNYDRTCSGSILSQIDMIRGVMDRNGMAGMAIINSEGSWGKMPQIDPELAAGWLARYYLLQAGHGVSRVYWYGWNVGPWGSLTGTDLQPNLTTLAYAETYRWLVGAVMPGPCAVAANRTTWTCTILRPDGFQGMAVWDTERERSYQPDPPQFTYYVDLEGEYHPIDGEVRIGARPILLQNQPPPARSQPPIRDRPPHTR